MTYKTLVLAILLLSFCFPIFAQHPTTNPSAEAVASVLGNRAPEVNWKPDSLLEADLNGDGNNEYVLSGVKDKEFIIGIVDGPFRKKSKHWMLEFRVEPNSLCSLKSTIKLEVVSEEIVGQIWDSIRKVKGIELQNGECDSFHIYWDPKAQEFKWWRH